MRIAYVITRADAVGGATIHVRDLAQAMLTRGDDACVFVGGEGPATEQLAGAGVPFRTVPSLGRAIRPGRDLRAFFELTAALREFRPDLVSTHTAKAGWIGRAACARLGLPVIYTPHGWAAGDRMPAIGRAVFRLAERAAARWASAIICVCKHEQKLALEKHIAPRAKLQVVYNGVHEIPPALQAVPASEPVRIISIGRFEPPKDHATLLHAMAQLKSLNWELELVGDGPLEAPCRTLACDLGIAERIEFSGYLPDPASALSRAQIFVLSSRSEALPRSVLEAMRAGLPVAASDVGGVSEAVHNEVNGILVSRGSIADLSAVLLRLIGDGSLRKRLGAAARLTYQSRFRFEDMVKRTAAVYESVITDLRKRS